MRGNWVPVSGRKNFDFLKLILAYVKGIVDHVAIEFSWPVRLRGAD